jgi:hypothetical protein
MKFIIFFLCLWFNFALLDLDPYCESGSGSRDPIESVSGSGSTTLLISTVPVYGPHISSYLPYMRKPYFLNNYATTTQSLLSLYHRRKGELIAVFHAPQPFFDCLQERISLGSKKKRLPNTTTTFIRKVNN